jgi:ribosomal protein S1
VIVLDVDSTGRRIRVSRKAVLDNEDADELREYQQREAAPSEQGFGSLGSQLRGVLDRRDAQKR